MNNQSKTIKKPLKKNSLASLTKAELLALLEAKEERVEELNEEVKIRNYHCKDCQVKFKTNVQKRKCPSCKSKNISLIEEDLTVIGTPIEELNKNDKEYIHVPGSNIKSTYKDAQTGEIVQGKRARSEPVNLGKMKKIKAVDSGIRSKEDTEWDEKIIRKTYNKTPRDRAEFKLVKRKCAGPCGKTYDINPALLVGRGHWECDDCLFSKR